jgi:hypothetical protein
MISFDEFMRKWTGKPIDLLKMSKTWLMDSLMIRPSNNNKILNSVIFSIPVYMVNNLRRFKISTKMFFHNYPVFTNVSMLCGGMIGFIDKKVSFSVRMFTTFPMIMVLTFMKRTGALAGTKFSFATTVGSKLLTTFQTKVMSPARKVVTLSTTELRLIRGWMYKFFMALTADKFHICSLTYSMQESKL